MSVTFIGYFLSKHEEISSRWVLHGSWCLLLLSLLASLLRNFYYQNYVYDSRVSPYIRKLSERVEIEALVAIDPTQVFVSEKNKILTPEEREDFATELKVKARNYLLAAEGSIARLRFAERVWRPCEPVALISLFFGLMFLVWFAVVNTR